ncbi:MAG: hypothetical protein WC470_02445 [Candidatus Paceibacterota bacterium]
MLSVTAYGYEKSAKILKLILPDFSDKPYANEMIIASVNAEVLDVDNALRPYLVVGGEIGEEDQMEEIAEILQNLGHDVELAPPHKFFPRKI